MKKNICVAVLLGFALAANSTNAQEFDEKLGAAAESAKGSSSTARRYQTANVFVAGDPARRLGAAWLIRSRNHIRGRIMTNVPSAGDAYTLWAVVFNNPTKCASELGCNDGDIANPAVRASVYNATGAISTSNGLGSGVVNLDFELGGGRLPNDQFILIGEPKGLLSSRGFKAEVHLVVDQHPPIVSGGGDSWIADLTTTNFPGMGPATSVAVSVFLPCRERSCPETVL